ncbi:glycosyltransferase 87 family protein [Mycetocola sp. 2940]|uniref:glycosyltransferase 87 family protein n=1 Tax=Mycetocola sp. 2940 TaxID=3156452 RepID=UPI003396CFBD
MNRRIGFWTAFVVVHAVLVWICLGLPGTGVGQNALGLPLGDVTFVYRPWIEQALSGGPIVGITEPWVYPIAAIVPMFAAMAAGPDQYGQAWLVLVTLLNAAGFAVLLGTRPSRRREAAAWWWLAFTALLGPIALARIDGVTVPVAVVALLIAARHPFLAGVLLAILTWVKVWPAALIAALVVASRDRVAVLLAGAATSAGIAVLVFVLGGGEHLFGFVGEQASRGLQIEAPVATPYLWLASAQVETSFIYYDRQILTFQVAGPGSGEAARLMTPLLALAATGAVLAGVLAVRRGASVVRLLPSLALALVLVLIVFNKVGSPQFQTWLIAPVVLGLLYRGRHFAWPAALALGLAALTQLLYPYLYGMLLTATPAMVALLSVRNAGLVVLLAWALVDVWRAGAAADQSSSSAFSRRSTLPVSSPE